MTELPVLDAVDQRVLGCLLEKQITVPATYPLTLNALRTACNQTSNRDPVTDLDERTVELTARSLRDRGLLRIVWADTGRRVLKYHQLVTETLGLADDERALITALLLRGPQSSGELRVRTERLHPFVDRSDVEDCLRRLASRAEPMVRIERQVGRADPRWAHCLGPAQQTPSALDPGPGPGAASGIGPGAGSGVGSSAGTGAARSGGESVGQGASERERPLRDGAAARDARVRTAYATVAPDYAERFGAELADLPFECWLLDRVVAEAAGRPVVDAGCGPGHLTAHLAAAGADARGIDLTPEMIEQANGRFPGVRYDVGDLTRLLRPENAHGWGAVLAWYSLIHLTPSELPPVVRSLARPLVPGGLLLLAVHAGREVRRMTSLAGHEVALDVVLHEPAELVAAARSAGLTDVEWFARGPLAARAETTTRCYLLARSPSDRTP